MRTSYFKTLSIAVICLLFTAGLVSAARTLDVSGTLSAQKNQNNWIATDTVLGSLVNAGTAVTSTAAELNIMDGVTATATELNYLDITTLGTGAASKAVVLDAGDDYTWPATGILTYGVLKDGPNATTVTATGVELNYLDITTLGTGAASKAVVLDAGDDYTWPATGILTYGVLRDGPGAVTVTSSGTELNYVDVTTAGTVEATKAVVTDANKGVSGLGDVSITPGDGANGDLKELTGLWRSRDWSVGASVNGTTNTVTTDLMPDTTEDANWTATANMTVAESTTLERVGSSALQITVGATPAAGNGADNTLTSGDQDWTADESVGMWMRCSAVQTAGDWVLEITDSVAGATTVNVPALATADTWTWVEMDISGVADASKDVITSIALDLSAAGAAAQANAVCLFDFMVKWDAADEEALSQNVLEGSIPTALAMTTATGGNRIPVVLTEYTDYFIHYEAGNDFFVAITDQSANSVWGRAAIQ